MTHLRIFPTLTLTLAASLWLAAGETPSIAAGGRTSCGPSGCQIVADDAAAQPNFHNGIRSADAAAAASQPVGGIKRTIKKFIRSITPDTRSAPTDRRWRRWRAEPAPQPAPEPAPEPAPDPTPQPPAITIPPLPARLLLVAIEDPDRRTPTQTTVDLWAVAQVNYADGKSAFRRFSIRDTSLSAPYRALIAAALAEPTPANALPYYALWRREPSAPPKQLAHIPTPNTPSALADALKPYTTP